MEYNRLMWASRRGMLELDLILMPFLEHVYPTLSPRDQESFVRLLGEQDQDLFAWLMHRSDPANPDLTDIVNIIRDHTGLKV